jgi:hypothetical protein
MEYGGGSEMTLWASIQREIDEADEYLFNP